MLRIDVEEAGGKAKPTEGITTRSSFLRHPTIHNPTHLHPNPKSKARPQVNPCGGHNLGSVSQAAGLCILGRGEAAGLCILGLPPQQPHVRGHVED